MTPRAQSRYRPRLGWAIRRGIADYYDRLGLTVLGSVALLVPIMLATAAGAALDLMLPKAASTIIMLLVAWYGVSFMWAGNVLQAHRIAFFEEPGPDAFAEVFRAYGVAILKLATVQLLITLIVLLDTVFFLRQKVWIMQMAGVVMAYILLLWSFMALWQYPFLMIEKGGTLKIIKKSALVTMDNPFFTAGALFVTIAGGALLIISMVGIALGFGGIMSCYLVRAHRECLKKYEMVEDEPENPVDGGWPKSKEPPRRLNPRALVAGSLHKPKPEDPSAFPTEGDQSRWLT